MGLVSSIVGGGVSGVIDSVSKVVDQFVESPSEANAHELKTKALDMQIALKQLDVNAAEASHRSILVAGWRPACGWVCAAGLAYAYIVQPLLIYILAIVSPATPPPPPIDLAGMMPVLLGMLGLGSLRTLEKRQGTSR